MKIAAKEADETEYWLQIAKSVGKLPRLSRTITKHFKHQKSDFKNHWIIEERTN
jgi:hypothetical protein